MIVVPGVPADMAPYVPSILDSYLERVGLPLGHPAPRWDQGKHPWTRSPSTRRFGGGRKRGAVPGAMQQGFTCTVQRGVGHMEQCMGQPMMNTAGHSPAGDAMDTPSLAELVAAVTGLDSPTTIPSSPRPPSCMASLPRVHCSQMVVLKELGAGAWGTVFQVMLPSGHLAAAKVYQSCDKLEFTITPEVETMLSLAGPGVPEVYGIVVGDDGGAMGYLMEYVEGITLAEMAALWPHMPRHERQQVILRLAGIMAHVHRQGVLHCDLKADNVMFTLSPQGRVTSVKVIDYGLSLKLTNGMAVTQIRGTPAYMAPEMCTHGVAVITSAADVFSLAQIIYFLNTGRQPHAELTQEQLCQRMLSTGLQHLPPVADTLDRRVLHACRNPDPGLRPTCSTLAQVYELALAGCEAAAHVLLSQPTPQVVERPAMLNYVASAELLATLGATAAVVDDTATLRLEAQRLVHTLNFDASVMRSPPVAAPVAAPAHGVVQQPAQPPVAQAQPAGRQCIQPVISPVQATHSKHAMATVGNVQKGHVQPPVHSPPPVPPVPAAHSADVQMEAAARSEHAIRPPVPAAESLLPALQAALAAALAAPPPPAPSPSLLNAACRGDARFWWSGGQYLHQLPHDTCAWVPVGCH